MRGLFLLLLWLGLSLGQEYDRPMPRRVRRNNNGPLMLGLISGLFGGVVGGVIKSRSLNQKYAKEKKQLLDYVTMQEDVYKQVRPLDTAVLSSPQSLTHSHTDHPPSPTTSKRAQRDQQWQTEYQKLYKAYEKLETETMERDYEEFKAPDTNGDDMISRAEFAIYVRKYLSSFPELSEKDFPKFDEFDLNGDGIVSFEEWQQFLALQSQEKAKGGSAKKNDGLLDALYSTSAGSGSFNDLDRQMAQQQRGGRQGGRHR